MDPVERREEDVGDGGADANGGGEGGGGEASNSSGGEGDGTGPENVADGNEVDEPMHDNNDEMPYANWALRLADEPLPESVLHVMAQVLQNDMLVENILEKIILDNDRASIRFCRLVSKQWLCAIAKLYRKMKRPQFIVNTNKDSSLLNEPRPRPFFEQHTLLYEFIKPMARHDRIEGFIPTFSLTLGASYFRKSNYTDFVNCLVQCGPSLVELYIRFPKNSAMSFLLPPTITLPNLNTFGVSFSGQSLLGHNFPMAYHHQHDYFPNNCSIHLVQTILNASSSLRRLEFMSCPNPMNPPDMENLYLPDSLTSIYIDTPFRDFELFLRKSLPFLTEIRINATIALYSEETIYDLFSKMSPTLRTVWLTGSAGTRRSLPIRLPRMEYLTKFVMFKPWEFEERNPPTSFEETFPVLETLVFANQTEYSFSYLMSGMKSTTVTSFCVWLTSLRPHPPVMNFPPMGLPVGEDQPNRLIPNIQVVQEPAGNLQERRERMRHALQQMRLDIMERHHRRMRQQPAGAGGGEGAGRDGDDVPLLANGEGPRAQIRRALMLRQAQERAEERERRQDGVDVIRLVQNNGEAADRPDPFHLPRWRRDPELIEQDRYRFLAQRARIAWEYRQRLRERQAGGHGAPRGAGEPAPGADEIEPGPLLPVPLLPPGREIGRRPFPFYHRPPMHPHPQVQVVIERVRPPYDDAMDVVMNQPPRVVIRRLDDRVWIGGPPAGLQRQAAAGPQQPLPPAAAAAQGAQNNEEPDPPAGEERPASPERPGEQNPIRAVYQRLLDRMEVDREEVDNAIHREVERDEARDGLFAGIFGRREEAANNANNDSDDEEDDSDNEREIGEEEGGDGRLVRRLEVLAAAAVQAAAGNNDHGEPPLVPPIPPEIQEVRPAEVDVEVQGGVNQVNVAVQEAFRVIRDDPPLNPGNAIAPPPPGDEGGVNNDPPQRAIIAARPANERNNGDGDEFRAAIGGVRRRLRQQEARNLRDLRQLRHRMLMDLAHPRGGRHAPPGGAAGGGGPHVPLPERPVTMTKEKMLSINIAFPNLVKLTINISGPETCGLKYIFEEMRSLQSLRIIVENSLWTIKWDSLLTGIPADFCDAVRSSTELWDEVYLNENHVSIRNLIKLEELMLLECIKVDDHREQHRSLEEHYISDVAFHFGLLKMKELKHLTVTPGFAPSAAMYKKWYEEKGYKIKARPRARLDVSYYEYH